MNTPSQDAATALSPGAILLIQLALALGGFAIGKEPERILHGWNSREVVNQKRDAIESMLTDSFYK